MSDRIDFSPFRDNAPIITISLSGRDANICVFFSMNCCTKMFEHHEQGDDFRTDYAFAGALLYALPVLAFYLIAAAAAGNRKRR